MASADVLEPELLNRRRWKPPAWAWLAEATAAVFALVVANIFAWPRDPGFTTWPLNPFIAVVILVSLRYGVSAGLGTGLLAGGVWLATVGGLRGLEIGPEVVETELIGMPAMLVLTGLWVGGFVQQAHGRVLFYQKAAKQSAREIASARATLDRLEARLQEQTQQATLVTTAADDLLERLKRMSELPEDRVCDDLAQVCAECLGVDAAVFLKRDAQLHLAAIRGNGWPQRPADRLASDEGLAGLALERGTMVTSLEAKDPQGEPFSLCGPLKGPDGERLGAVGFQRVSFRQINAPFLQRLSALLDWTAACLVRARRQATSAEGALPLERSFLNLVLEARSSRARAGALLLFCIGRFDAYAAEQQPSVRAAAIRMLLRTVRAGDLVCETGHPDMFAVILDTPSSHSPGCHEAVLCRLRQAYRGEIAFRQGMPPYLLFAAIAMPPTAEGFDAAVADVSWRFISPDIAKGESDAGQNASLGAQWRAVS
ncbi:MAG: hypothetical protein HYY16_11585 [Planctomycetes bacterium]|nr:hypothetical protein [Planctomycetota bacterium]